jgi:transaldolase
MSTRAAGGDPGLFKHVLTDKGIEGFLADWAKTGQAI